jgi:hypothetical protein
VRGKELERESGNRPTVALTLTDGRKMNVRVVDTAFYINLAKPKHFAKLEARDASGNPQTVSFGISYLPGQPH